jgi:hypothetical protein
MKRKSILIAIALLTITVTAFAQRRRGGWNLGEISDPSNRNGVPSWEVDAAFPDDVFTFARLRYNSFYGGRRGGGGWATDFPDSDLNFSLRLQQLTSLKVNPNPVIVDLHSEQVLDYPFLYMIEPGSLYFEENEVAMLRRFCLTGGFMMVDDFWGQEEYDNFEQEISRVFPDRKIVDVPLEHEIFHCVYDLKEKPQVPSIHAAQSGRGHGVTWEPRWDSDTSIPHYRAIFDDDGRIMVFICHNTDLGDGWEREGENQWYFEEFSVKKSYPLGINIVVYAMTH